MSNAVMHVIGARPNFPKAAPVIRALEGRFVEQFVVHTGQHYDRQMSEVFFRELDMPEPDINLGIGSGSHTAQTAKAMIRLEELFVQHRPAVVAVYGDVNSTLAAALTASKLGIPVAHVESGLRSFDDTMPEELNRAVTDRLSDVLFVTCEDAVINLAKEGISGNNVQFVGNSMIDSLLSKMAAIKERNASSRLSLPSQFAVVTVHRPSNVDNESDSIEVANMLMQLATHVPLVVPLHPRGRKNLESAGLKSGANLTVVEPLGYIDFLSLLSDAAFVLTDSGGVQEESTVMGIPCLTMRPNTERPVTISCGTNRLVSREHVVSSATLILSQEKPSSWPVPPLWDGAAADRIGNELVKRYNL